mmetsp:Transcript_115592/g.333947  ORF Transcript_115592/g.333947 Transcript_115592/m.333947 type:complete len:243 (+) Transcript_115592:643-1371(+)
MMAEGVPQQLLGLPEDVVDQLRHCGIGGHVLEQSAVDPAPVLVPGKIWACLGHLLHEKGRLFCGQHLDDLLQHIVRMGRPDSLDHVAPQADGEVCGDLPVNLLERQLNHPATRGLEGQAAHHARLEQSIDRAGQLVAAGVQPCCEVGRDLRIRGLHVPWPGMIAPPVLVLRWLTRRPLPAPPPLQGAARTTAAPDVGQGGGGNIGGLFRRNGRCWHLSRLLLGRQRLVLRLPLGRMCTASCA